MRKTLQTLRYLAKSFSGVIVLGMIVMLGTVAVTDLVFFLTSQSSTVNYDLSLTVPFEVTAGIFALIIGLGLFISDFKVGLANGISRKTFLLANLPSALIASAIFSIFILIVEKIHGLFWPIISISEIFYPQIGWAWLLFFQFTLYFLLIMAGRLITLAYYRSSTVGKWAISLAPFILYGILQVADARFAGKVFRAINEYRRSSMALEIAPWTLLVYSVIVFGLVYLLIRRAPLKD
jgi:hypothetical protein